MKKEHTIEYKLHSQIVEVRPYFWWWVGDKESLSVESIVEGVIAYGNMNDVHKLFQILGREKVKLIFLQQIRHKRCNYSPCTINFFKKVFTRYV
jgi:hypothetical protein